jgi:hypothetical protein
MSSRWRLAVLGGLFALVTACGNGGDGDSDGVASMSESNSSSSATQAADEKSDIDQMRDFAKCMRENGVDMADPDPNSPGAGGISVDGPEEKAKTDKAMAKCKHLMPNGGEEDKPTAKDLDQGRKTAQCLRDHGIDVKDPTMENPGLDVSAGDGGNDTDKLDKAMKECIPEGAKTQEHTNNGGGK